MVSSLLNLHLSINVGVIVDHVVYFYADVCMKENVVPSSFSASKSTAQSTPCCPPQGSNAKKKKTLATNVMQQTASVHTPQQDLSNNGQSTFIRAKIQSNQAKKIFRQHRCSLMFVRYFDLLYVYLNHNDVSASQFVSIVNASTPGSSKYSRVNTSTPGSSKYRQQAFEGTVKNLNFEMDASHQTKKYHHDNNDNFEDIGMPKYFAIIIVGYSISNLYKYF